MLKVVWSNLRAMFLNDFAIDEKMLFDKSSYFYYLLLQISL